METRERLIRGVDYQNRSENLRLPLTRFPRGRVSPRTVVTIGNDPSESEERVHAYRTVEKLK